jgi:hypothetical protein
MHEQSAEGEFAVAAVSHTAVVKTEIKLDYTVYKHSVRIAQ